MKTAPLALAGLMFISLHAFSQTKPKKTTGTKPAPAVVVPKTARAVKLADLKITAVIDTTKFNIRDESSSSLSFSFNDARGLDFDLGDGKDYMKEKAEYSNREEHVVSITSRLMKLERYYDSATIVINGNKYWMVKSTLRDVPLYWADMHEKKKLSSDQLTTFLKSDKATHESAVLATYFYVKHPVTGQMISLSVGYSNNGEELKDVNDIMTNIAKSIRFK